MRELHVVADERPPEKFYGLRPSDHSSTSYPRRMGHSSAVTNRHATSDGRGTRRELDLTMNTHRVGECMFVKGPGGAVWSMEDFSEAPPTLLLEEGQ